MDNKLIGNRIEQRRKSLGLTLESVASEIGVAKSTIQRYEKGTISKIKLPVIEAISRVLDVDPAWICCKTDIMEPHSSSVEEQKETAAIDIVDDDLREYLDELRSRPEKRLLFSVTKNATKSQIEAIVKMIEEMQGN